MVEIDMRLNCNNHDQKNQVTTFTRTVKFQTDKLNFNGTVPNNMAVHV